MPTFSDALLLDTTGTLLTAAGAFLAGLGAFLSGIAALRLASRNPEKKKPT